MSQMENKLNELKEQILFEEHSDDEWKHIKRNADTELKVATDEEVTEFINSGAGPLLEQILEYMD